MRSPVEYKMKRSLPSDWFSFFFRSSWKLQMLTPAWIEDHAGEKRTLKSLLDLFWARLERFFSRSERDREWKVLTFVVLFLKSIRIISKGANDLYSTGIFKSYPKSNVTWVTWDLFDRPLVNHVYYISFFLYCPVLRRNTNFSFRKNFFDLFSSTIKCRWRKKRLRYEKVICFNKISSMFWNEWWLLIRANDHKWLLELVWLSDLFLILIPSLLIPNSNI